MTTATTTASGKAPLLRGSPKLSQEQVVGVITLLLLGVFALALPGFATTQNILGLLRSISILGILGLGMGLVVISRGIDLSEIALMACPWAIGLVAISTRSAVILGGHACAGHRNRRGSVQRPDGRLR